MIFAVLDVSLIMGLNIGEIDKVFYINICCFCRNNSQIDTCGTLFAHNTIATVGINFVQQSVHLCCVTYRTLDP